MDVTSEALSPSTLSGLARLHCCLPCVATSVKFGKDSLQAQVVVVHECTSRFLVSLFNYHLDEYDVYSFPTPEARVVCWLIVFLLTGVNVLHAFGGKQL